VSFLLVFVLILVPGCFSSTPQAPPPAKVGFWVQNKQDNAVFVEVPEFMYQTRSEGGTVQVSAAGFFPYQAKGEEIAVLTPDPQFWLAAIMWSEARGQSLEGQAAVGQVVLNRTRDPRFNNTIVDVIFESSRSNSGRSIYQFSPVIDGQIYLAFLDPNFGSFLDLAEKILAGELLNPALQSALGFFNPEKVQAYDPYKKNWVWKQPVIGQIDSHVFFTVP